MAQTHAKGQAQTRLSPNQPDPGTSHINEDIWEKDHPQEQFNSPRPLSSMSQTGHWESPSFIPAWDRCYSNEEILEPAHLGTSGNISALMWPNLLLQQCPGHA